MERLVSAWLATHRSDNTRAAYRRDLAAYVAWCEAGARDPLAAQPDDLDRYRDDCLAAGSSPATVTRRLSGVASFFRFAAAVGAVDRNPASEVDRPAAERPAAPVLDDAELDALFDAAGELGAKTGALVGLLARDGMRLGEVLAIDIPRVRLRGGAVSVEVDRRGARTEVELAPATAAVVADYLGSRRRGPLFLGDAVAAQPRARLTRFGADFLIKRAGTTARLDKPVSASVLRRSYIGAAHRAGAPVADIARQVGHREARETVRVLDSGR